MSEIFMASNGLQIKTNERARGTLMWRIADDRDLDPTSYAFKHPWTKVGPHSEDSDLSEALFEYKLALRDEQRGVWRSPNYPDFAVYTRGDENVSLAERRGAVNATIRVLNEPYGVSAVVSRQRRGGAGTAGEAAHEVVREFFEAFPPSAPWHKAEPGEAWMLTISECAPEAYVLSNSGVFLGTRHSWAQEHPIITDGKKMEVVD